MDNEMGNGGSNFKLPLIVAIAVVMVLVVSVLPAINFGVNGGNNWDVSSAISYLNNAGYAVWATGSLTPGGVPVAQVDGTLATDSGLTYNSGTDTLTTTNLTASTGRTASYVIAASDATALEKAQADVVCNGYSSLSGTIAGANLTTVNYYTGTLTTAGKVTNTLTGTSVTLPAGSVDSTKINISASDTITVTLDAGQSGLAFSGTSALTGNPVTLSAGANILTLTGAGYFWIQGMGDEVKIQTVLNSLTAGGKIHFTSGIYGIANTITIPNNLPFWFDGSGMPTWKPGQWSGTSATALDGTQFRGYSGFNYSATTKDLFVRAGSTVAGTLKMTDLAIMPSYSAGLSTLNGSITYGIEDAYSSEVFLDNFMIMSWGWSEAACPINYASTPYAREYGLYIHGGGGMGSKFVVGHISFIGLFVPGFFAGVDNITIETLREVGTGTGLNCGCIWGNYIENCAAYAVASGRCVEFGSSNLGCYNEINTMEIEALVSPYSTYTVTLRADGTAHIGSVYIWPTLYSKNILTISNYDDRIVNNTKVYNLAGTLLWQTIPLSKKITSPFGAAIVNPFGTSSIGSGGSANYPTSTTIYTANVPVDIVFPDGTISECLIKDSAATTVYQEVPTTTKHYLLLPNYTIKLTWTVKPTPVCVHAVMGYVATTTGLPAATAVPIDSTNYVCTSTAGLFCTIADTGATITVYDGSSNVKGNIVDSGLTSITHYLIQAGQIINFGAFGGTAVTVTYVGYP